MRVTRPGRPRLQATTVSLKNAGGPAECIIFQTLTGLTVGATPSSSWRRAIQASQRSSASTSISVALGPSGGGQPPDTFTAVRGTFTASAEADALMFVNDSPAGYTAVFVDEIRVTAVVCATITGQNECTASECTWSSGNCFEPEPEPEPEPEAQHSGTPSGFTYIGCYMDSTPRDLEFKAGDLGEQDDDSAQGSPSRVMACATLCAGYQYMGLQWQNECCDNNYGSLGEAESSDCDGDGELTNGVADGRANRRTAAGVCATLSTRSPTRAKVTNQSRNVTCLRLQRARMRSARGRRDQRVRGCGPRVHGGYLRSLRSYRILRSWHGNAGLRTSRRPGLSLSPLVDPMALELPLMALELPPLGQVTADNEH